MKTVKNITSPSVLRGKKGEIEKYLRFTYLEQDLPWGYNGNSKNPAHTSCE